MKNKLTDLNDHLFCQMERLSDATISVEEMTKEINRAKAISGIASQIITNARLALDAQVAINDGLITNPPQMLGITSEQKI